MIDLDILRTPRTPDELRAYVISLRRWVRENPAEFKRALRKSGLYKEFIDELTPLSCFAVLAYPSDYSVRWVPGNQPYDAIVYDAHGNEADRVELTSPQAGSSEARDRELVAERGYGHVRVGVPNDEFEALIPHVLKTARCKALKDYGSCSLVFAIEPLPPFEGWEQVYSETTTRLAEDLRGIAFQAPRVYLLLMPDTLVTIHQ